MPEDLRTLAQPLVDNPPRQPAPLAALERRSSNRRRRRSAGALAVAAVSATGLLAARSSSQDTVVEVVTGPAQIATAPPAEDVPPPPVTQRASLEGRPAPPVEGPTLDGGGIRLADLRGRYVLVNFFATWCGPCRTEHPKLVEFADRHRAAGDVEVLTVVYDDEMGRVGEFFSEQGGDWPVVDDVAAWAAFGVRGIPESFLVNPDGIVVAQINGGVSADRLDDLLRDAGSGQG